MRVLVTGADGFTGQHLERRAKAQGHEVVSFKSDLTNCLEVRSEIQKIKPAWVIHLAAISFVGDSDASCFYSVNVVGTTNLLDALAGSEDIPQKILLVSSANVYGNTSYLPIDETQLPCPVNHYAMSKLAMETLAKTYLDRLPILFARPFNYTGIGQSVSFLIPKIVSHFISKAEFIELGNIDIEREFNDVEFVCDSYLNLIKYAVVGETYNICSGKAYSLREVIEILEDLTRHKIKITINDDYVRSNEVKKLYGSPLKLNTLLNKHRVELKAKALSKILTQMLNQSKCV